MCMAVGHAAGNEKSYNCEREFDKEGFILFCHLVNWCKSYFSIGITVLFCLCDHDCRETF